MATLSELLESIAKNSSSVERLKGLFESLDKAKTKALAAGDPKLLVNLNKLEALTIKLQNAEAKRATRLEKLQKLEEEVGLTEEQKLKRQKQLIEQLDKAQAEYDQTAKKLSKVNEGFKKQEKAIAEANEAAMAHWKQHTLLGKAFTATTGSLARLAAGLGFATLAGKAWNRWTEAAEVRQQILIQNFGDLNKAASLGDAASQIYELDTAMLKATATAQRMGVDTRVVGQSMVKFSRIAGTDNPEALRILTEGAITTSRALGIDVAEAVDFVALRMDKFGGTAASSIIALNEMRLEAKRINAMLGRTVIRGDDVTRALMEMSRQTNVYAIDQRLIGKTLRDNVARLQAYGESYEQARMKAEAFTKAISGEAPEWMKVLAGQNIVRDMFKAFGKGGKEGVAAFEEEFGKALDAAKPGLSKKIQGILRDIQSGKISRYSGERLIQELTAQTEVGMNAMNTEILRLMKQTGGNAAAVISDQFQVSWEVANSMIEQAEKWEKQQKEVNKAVGENADALQKRFSTLLKNDRATAESIAKMEKGEKKAAIKTLMRRKEELELVQAQVQRRKEEEEMRQKRSQQLDEEIAKLEKLKETADSPELREAFQLLIEEKVAEKSQLLKKGDQQVKELRKVEEINEELVADFKHYADLTGKSFNAMITELSSIKNMLLIGGIMSLGGRLAKNFKLGKKMAEASMASRGLLGKLTGKFGSFKNAVDGGFNKLGGKFGKMGKLARGVGALGAGWAAFEAGQWIGKNLINPLVTKLEKVLWNALKTYFPNVAKDLKDMHDKAVGDRSEELLQDNKMAMYKVIKKVAGGVVAPSAGGGITGDARRDMVIWRTSLKQAGGDVQKAMEIFEKKLKKVHVRKLQQEGLSKEAAQKRVAENIAKYQETQQAKKDRPKTAAAVMAPVGDTGTMVPVDEAATQLGDKAEEAVAAGAGPAGQEAATGEEPYGEITSPINADGSINMKVYNMGMAVQSAMKMMKKRRAKA